MKWLIWLLAIAIGCTHPNPNPEPEPVYTRFLSGVEVRVINNVAECLDINASTGYRASCVGVGNTRMVRANGGTGGPRTISITVVARTKEGKYIGTATQQFQIPYGGETYHTAWEVNSVNRLPQY